MAKWVYFRAKELPFLAEMTAKNHRAMQVLLIAMSFMRGGNSVTVPLASFVREADCSVDTVRRALAYLSAAGVMSSVRVDDGLQDGNKYALNLEIAQRVRRDTGDVKPEDDLEIKAEGDDEVPY